MIVHIRHGKRNRDRDVPLSLKLRETLREYWRWMRPKTYLFPGTENGWRADKPITPKVPWEACREAAQRAGITKAVRPHLIRHSFATHLLEGGADLPTVQLSGPAQLKRNSQEVHHPGVNNGEVRFQRVRLDDGRHCVGRVVKTVHEFEAQRNQKRDAQQHEWHSRTGVNLR